jgi:hypothetical protein
MSDTVDDELAFDIAYALPRMSARKWGLTDVQRRTLARDIVDHLKVRGWQFRRL